MAGLFFCLAPAESAGLFFCPAECERPTSVYSGLSVTHVNYTATTQKPFTLLYSNFFVNLPYSSVQQYSRCTSFLYTAYDTPEGIPSSVVPPQIPDTTTPGRYAGQHSRPIIIRYIRVQQCAPVVDSCQTVQHTTGYASPATYDLAPVSSQSTACRASASLLPGIDGQGARAEGRPGSRRAARNHWRLAAASLFGLSADSQ